MVVAVAPAITRHRDRTIERTADYNIGIAHGASILPDGTPEIHTLNRLLKLRELLYSGVIERGIVTGRNEAEPMAEYAMTKLGIPQEKIYVEPNSWSIVTNMYYSRRMIDRWIKNGEISPSVLLHYIIQTWAVRRATDDGRWVLPMYQLIIHGVEDGRPKEIVWEVDESKEPERLKIDQIASHIPIVSRYRPDIAQLLASLTNPAVVTRYGKRLLPR